MIRGLYKAAQGMIHESMRIDILANNLANVNATGYKKSRLQVTSSFDADFTNYLQRYIETEPSANVREVPEFLLVRYDVDFAEGAFKETGNTLDVAIKGRGFFGVQLPNDTVAYTRDGAFNMDANGFLVTAQNFRVLDRDGFPVQLSTETQTIVIRPNGEIIADGAEIASLMAVDFDEPYPLSKIGANLFEVNPPPLLTLDAGLQMELDSEILPADLEAAFANRGTPLSPDASVSVVTAGKAWRIADNANSASYIVREKDGRLNVYNDADFAPKPVSFGDNGTQLMQGFLEASNVSPIHEMVQMIETLRNFESYQRTIRAFEESIQQINEVTRS